MATSPERMNRTRWGWWAGWGIVAALSVAISLYSFPGYLPFFPGVERLPLGPAAPIIPYGPDVGRIPLDPGFPGLHAFVIALHAVPSGLALLVGPFQFVAPLRRRYLAAHRWVGRFYLVCVALGSVTGLVAGISAVTGFTAQVGFLLLVAMWAYSGWMAYSSIRKGRVQLHRIWMVRNFALTLAAVVLRLVLISLQAFTSVPFDDIYYVSVWAGILVPLVFAEWFIVQRTLRPLAQKQRQH